ncbi:DUF2268 domain-containing putative Zn-dependent protease [Cytobacillus sp. FJAT-54145]|uniref:DUF2268 domain-containing putative Zn-dependent protease n=1 Tax=Cytobacillus spartinae TaxID=3299023 RepID=A0ABW6K763_9BACI
MTVIKQITPKELFDHRGELESFLAEPLSLLVNETTWMKDWKHLAQRFQLFKFKELTQDEALSYQWDKEKISKWVLETVEEVKKHLSFGEITVTVFPALPFRWFKKYDQSIWTNGFTNGPNNIQIAVPPNPDEHFFKQMLAHELHHATPQNPIYQLTLDTFSLIEWFKMEGGAEYFSLSLYRDKRWWKDDYTPKVKEHYWNAVQHRLHTTDDQEKARLCFGDPDNGIPYMTGYAFAYDLFKDFTSKTKNTTFKDLLQIPPMTLIQTYKEEG